MKISLTLVGLVSLALVPFVVKAFLPRFAVVAVIRSDRAAAGIYRLLELIKISGAHVSADLSAAPLDAGLLVVDAADGGVYELRRRLAPGTVVLGGLGLATADSTAEDRAAAEDLFGFRRLGWMGRYFTDLSAAGEAPRAVVAAWEAQNGKWPYAGSGLLLIKDDGTVLALPDGEALGAGRVSLLSSLSGKRDYGLGDGIKLYTWFDVIAPAAGDIAGNGDSTILADFVVDLNDRGRELCRAAGVPERFPAVLRFQAEYAAYYYAAELPRGDENFGAASPAGFAAFKRLFTPHVAGAERQAFWRLLAPLAAALVKEAVAGTTASRPAAVAAIGDQTAPAAAEIGGISLRSRITNKNIELYKNGSWTSLFIKGVNLGLALPGKWFTEMPRDANRYFRWLALMADMNANAVRLYTLAPPEFYRALADFNRLHPATPIYLLQEIWPEEIVPDHDYLAEAYSRAYDEEVRLAVDAIHGALDIPERRYRAYGRYDADVSIWTIAYLIGRELEPEEIIATNARNPNFNYVGRYLSAPEGPAAEAWLARTADRLTSYEVEKYRRQTPTAAVGWPTLDPVQHDSEWNPVSGKESEYNDKAVFDADSIQVGEANRAGFFGAYHIYPNYPDFMNNEQGYDGYRDEAGRLRYGGYLAEFAAGRTHPSLVAEFGLANGMATAHLSPDGYDHGGLSETAAAAGLVRLAKAIRREGYLGCLIFEWMDEWAKKTWTTEPFMTPYENHVFWHNAIDPEQNYGLLAMESTEPRLFFTGTADADFGVKLAARANAAFLYLDFSFKSNFAAKAYLEAGGSLLIGLDVYDRYRGQFRYQPDSAAAAPSGMEFLMELKAAEAVFMATPDYDWGAYRYSSLPRRDGVWRPARFTANKGRVRKDGSVIAAVAADRLRLRYGDFTASDANIDLSGGVLTIRLPWNALGFSDPPAGLVIDDPRPYTGFPGRDVLRTAKSDGIVVSLVAVGGVAAGVATGGAAGVAAPIVPISFTLPRPIIADDGWLERPKAAYYAIKEYFATIE